MTTFYSCVAAFLLIFGACEAANANTEKASPIFTAPLTNLDGETTTLADISKHKPTYIKLWASWCSDCLTQMHHFEDTFQKHGNDINVLGINVWINDSHDAISRVIKKYDLSLPVLLDKAGKLAAAFDLIGTPLHILIDEKGRIVHQGHQVSPQLDEKISLLATGKLTSKDEITYADLPTATEKLPAPTGINVVLFTATFCDWYLKDSRPSMASNCIAAQKFVNNHSQDMANISWNVLVSRLWTGPKELAEYSEKFEISVARSIDETNHAFLSHKVKTFPTLIIFDGAKEIGRISDFSNPQDTAKSFTDIVR